MTDNNQVPQPTASTNAQPKDQNVLTFMMQLVQEKFGDDVDNEFLTGEANRLYDLFGDRLVSYFEPLLTNEQKVQFDQMVEQGNNQDVLLTFLTQAIPDLENKIMQILVNFRMEYISAKEESAATTAAPL